MSKKKVNDDIGCITCPYNAKKLHPDMPFGCFEYQSNAIDTECYKHSQKKDTQEKQRVHNRWIKNHPHWKNTPHITYWYYCETQEAFDKFISMYPDVEHMPNESWKSMYDILILK